MSATQSILPWTVSINLVCVLTWCGRGLGPRRVETDGGLEDGCCIFWMILGGEWWKCESRLRRREGEGGEGQNRSNHARLRTRFVVMLSFRLSPRLQLRTTFQYYSSTSTVMRASIFP